MKVKYLISLLFLVMVTVWLAILSTPDENLHIVACDVGQGDSVLIYKGNTQVLIDGGPDKKVLDCLSKNVPFWDKTIELVVLTHPHTDHYKGLIDVFRNYTVDSFMSSGLDSSNDGYQVLKNEISTSGAQILDPIKVENVDIDMIHLDVVWPDAEYIASNSSSKSQSSTVNVLGSFDSKDDPNDFSIVLNLTYKDFDAILTGDVGPAVIKDFENAGEQIDVEYIKVPHHGSRNGITKELLDIVKPEVAVISVGKNNRYGHPHKEAIDLLNERNVKILRTDEVGEVDLATDGFNYWIEH